MKFTNSTIFLLRGLELMRSTETIDQSSLVKTLGFLNAYINDVNHENDLDCPLYLLFNPLDEAVFKDFVDGEYETRMLKEDYDYPENHVVLLYDFPILYREDYKKVISGQYSRVSMGYRQLFPEEYMEKGKKIKTLSYHVFNKSKTLQIERELELGLDSGYLEGSELWEVFNIEKETLDINKILKKC